MLWAPQCTSTKIYKNYSMGGVNLSKCNCEWHERNEALMENKNSKQMHAGNANIIVKCENNKTCKLEQQQRVPCAESSD